MKKEAPATSKHFENIPPFFKTSSSDLESFLLTADELENQHKTNVSYRKKLQKIKEVRKFL